MLDFISNIAILNYAVTLSNNLFQGLNQQEYGTDLNNWKCWLTN